MYAKRTGIVAGWFLAMLACGVSVLTIFSLSRSVVSANRESPETAEPPALTGAELYAQHCAACHGDKGDGQGLAARFLYPKPRDFGEGKFRIVSTVNSKPSDADLLRVITNGMPGSAMIPYGHLSERDRKEIVTHVRALMLDGAVARMKKKLEDEGEDVDLPALKKKTEQALQPGEAFKIPPAPATDMAAAGRGEKLYQTVCASCHGKTGKGDGPQEQRNDDGMITRPRDLTQGYFKGGRDRDQLYARIMLGLPGSPMPSSANALKPDDAHDIISYVLSLSDPSSQAAVEHRRQSVTVTRVGALPESGGDNDWAAAKQTALVVSPLWWRDFANPELKVSAMHDGTTIAIRFTWKDATRNDAVVRPEDFEDMAAIQIYKGDHEPFFGMGSAVASVDTWLWRATTSRAAALANSKLDVYPFDDPLYKNLGKDKSFVQPDQQTARAAGNPIAEPNGVNNVTAKGPGSTTMRPKSSQFAKAGATWENGQWTVVFRRPLAVPAGDGVTLAPGDKVAAAFALWDGAARDRNGQKLVSIWHDLILEGAKP